MTGTNILKIINKLKLLILVLVFTANLIGCSTEENISKPEITKENNETKSINNKTENTNNEEEQDGVHSEADEEKIFKPIDWQYYEDKMQRDDVVDFEEYYNILTNEEQFIFLDTDEEITFNEFLKGIESDSEPDIEGIVLLDLDNQNGKELILNIYETGGHYLILTRDNRRIYGKMMSAREFEELQKDGKYLGSGGAGDSYFRRMTIDSNGVKEILIGEYHGEEKEDGTYEENLEVEGQLVTESLQNWMEKNYGNPVEWIE